MPNDKFDLNRPAEVERSPIKVAVERSLAIGLVALSALTVANATTPYGANPLNYIVALSEYTAR